MKSHFYLVGVLAAFSSAEAGTSTTDYTKDMNTSATSERIGMGPYVAIFGGANVYQTAHIDNARVECF
jgi:hypothetical protein